MKLFTYVTIMLMLMSVFSTGAFAASGGGNGNNGMGSQGNAAGNQGGEQNRVSVSGNDDPDDKGATERQQKNRDDYFAAKEKLQQINVNMNSGKINASSKEVFEVRQAYLLETIDYTISNLEDLKEKVDESQREDADEIIADLDYHISKLDAEKYIVENATTTKELAKSARNIHDIWRDAVKDAYKTRVKFVDDKVEIYLNKSTSLSERLSLEVEILQNQGEDTSELEELLLEYNGLIEQARQNRERARETYQNGGDTSGKYWSASAENLKDANAVLSRISRILQTYRQGVVSLNGDGTLLAKGNGTAVLSGDIAAEMTIDDAQLVIKDHAGDAKIKISNGSEIVLELDNSLEAEQKRALVYSDLTAKVRISGSRLTVMIKGTELDLKIEGNGSTVLSGEGTYTAVTGEESKHWASRFESGPEEYSSQEE